MTPEMRTQERKMKQMKENKIPNNKVAPLLYKTLHLDVFEANVTRE